MTCFMFILPSNTTKSKICETVTRVRDVTVTLGLETFPRAPSAAREKSTSITQDLKKFSGSPPVGEGVCAAASARPSDS